MPSDDCAHQGSCRYLPLHVSGSLSIAVFECDGRPQTSEAETCDHHEVVIPQEGAYVRRDRSGSVYLDETVVGFFEPGEPYVIEHLEPRRDVTTVIALKGGGERPPPPVGRAAIRASARVHIGHHALLRALDQHRCEPLAIDEMAASFVALVTQSAMAQAELSARVPPRRMFADDILIAVVEFMRRNSNRRLRLDEIARHAGYSAYHLSRAFRARMGVSLFQYWRQLRMRSAFQALLDTSASISDIALDHGFASSAHFTAQFTGWAGAPPSAIRRDAKLAAGRW